MAARIVEPGAEFLEWDSFRSGIEMMKAIHSAAFPFGHSDESLDKGLAIPTSITSVPIAEPDDTVAPKQQMIDMMESIGHCPIDVDKKHIPFLFSNICSLSMIPTFQPCDKFFNTICELFEYMNLGPRDTPVHMEYQSSTTSRISDTSSGFSDELSFDEFAKIHVKKDQMISAEKSAQNVEIF